MINNGTKNTINISPYISSSLDRGDSWGQPPALFYNLEVVNGVLQGQLINDVYLCRNSGDQIPIGEIEQSLVDEFSMWDNASQEDWNNFEMGLE